MKRRSGQTERLPLTLFSSYRPGKPEFEDCTYSSDLKWKN